MRQATLHTRPFLSTIGPYTLAIMAAVNTISIVVWMALLIASIPPHTPITSSAVLFIAAFPGIIVLFLLNSILLGLWIEYVTYSRGDRLRRQIEQDRVERDAARLATGKDSE